MIALVTLASSCREESKPTPTVPALPVEHDVGAALSHRAQGATGAGASLDNEKGPQIVDVDGNTRRGSAATLPVNGGIRGRLIPGPGTAGIPTTPVRWAVLEIPGKTPLRAELQLFPEDRADLVLQWMAPAEDALRANNASEQLAEINNGGPGEVEVLPPTVLKPGKHYFRVRVASGKKTPKGKKATGPSPTSSHPYLLTATVIDPEGGLEEEPNNRHSQAGILKAGDARTGYIGWRGDKDWYELSLEQATGDSIVRVDISGVDNLKLGLRVVDKTRRADAGRRGIVVVPENRVPWRTGRGVTVRDVAIDPKRLPYYAVAEALRSGPGNGRENYRIQMQVSTPTTPHEREPNWRPSNAMPLLPDQPVDGYIGHPTDWDVFRLDATERMIATVVVSGVPDVDVQLEHLDHAGTVLKTQNGAGVGGTERFMLLPVGPQPAFVRVSSRDYGFNVDAGYGISVSMEDASDREIEPNDEFHQAGRVMLPPGKPYKATIHPRGDSDYFAFKVTAPALEDARLMSIRIKGVEGMRLTAELLDSDQTLIARKAGIRPGNERPIKHEFTPGRYVLRVREDTGQVGNGETPYTVQIRDLGLVEVEAEAPAAPTPSP